MSSQFQIDTKRTREIAKENPLAAIVAIVASVAFPLAGIVIGFVLKDSLPKTSKVCFWLGFWLMLAGIIAGVVLMAFVELMEYRANSEASDQIRNLGILEKQLDSELAKIEREFQETIETPLLPTAPIIANPPPSPQNGAIRSSEHTPEEINRRRLKTKPTNVNGDSVTKQDYGNAKQSPAITQEPTQKKDDGEKSILPEQSEIESKLMPSVNEFHRVIGDQTFDTEVRKKQALESAIEKFRKGLPKDTFVFQFPVVNVGNEIRKTGQYRIFIGKCETNFGAMPLPTHPNHYTEKLSDSLAKSIDTTWKVEVRGKLGLKAVADNTDTEFVILKTQFRPNDQFTFCVVVVDSKTKLIKP